MVFDWVKKLTSASDKVDSSKDVSDAKNVVKEIKPKAEKAEKSKTKKIRAVKEKVKVFSESEAKEKSDCSVKSKKTTKKINTPAKIIEETIIKNIVVEDVIETNPVNKRGWLGRMFGGLEKSSSKLTDSIAGVFTKRKLDKDAIDDLQDILIMADMGVETAKTFTDNISANRFDKEVSDDEIKSALADEIEKVLSPLCEPLQARTDVSPHIILMVGVNGAGKTTTIGKLASKYIAEGKTVMLGAGDTFRAAAVEQLQAWGARVGAEVVAKEEGADAGALVYEAIEKAKSNNVDVLLIDTAGRLHNKAYLMEELKKINRVIKKLIPDAPHDTVLVLDGTVGQNAIEQVRHFSDCVNISGIIMTKLDGSARGGVLVNVAGQFDLSIHAIGVGETADDLNAFVAKDFAHGLLGMTTEKSL